MGWPSEVVPGLHEVDELGQIDLRARRGRHAADHRDVVVETEMPDGVVLSSSALLSSAYRRDTSRAWSARTWVSNPWFSSTITNTCLIGGIATAALTADWLDFGARRATNAAAESTEGGREGPVTPEKII
jgi:hypothetical protein